MTLCTYCVDDSSAILACSLDDRLDHKLFRQTTLSAGGNDDFVVGRRSKTVLLPTFLLQGDRCVICDTKDASDP